MTNGSEGMKDGPNAGYRERAAGETGRLLASLSRIRHGIMPAKKGQSRLSRTVKSGAALLEREADSVDGAVDVVFDVAGFPDGNARRGGSYLVSNLFSGVPLHQHLSCDHEVQA